MNVPKWCPSCRCYERIGIDGRRIVFACGTVGTMHPHKPKLRLSLRCLRAIALLAENK